MIDEEVVDDMPDPDKDGDGVLSLEEAIGYLEWLDDGLAEIGDEADRAQHFAIHTQIFFDLELEPEVIKFSSSALQDIRKKHGLT